MKSANLKYNPFFHCYLISHLLTSCYAKETANIWEYKVGKNANIAIAVCFAKP